MDFKKAIEFINWAKDSFYVSAANKKNTLKFFVKGNEVISLLKRGEKSRQIIEIMRKEKYDVWVSIPGSFISLADFILDIEEEMNKK